MSIELNIRWQKGNFRYYKLLVYQDLFNDWIVTTAWGGLRSRLGNFKNSTFATHKDAMDYVDFIALRRTKRGYVKQKQKVMNL